MGAARRTPLAFRAEISANSLYDCRRLNSFSSSAASQRKTQGRP